MAQIAVTILDPSNNRSAHLVETRLPVRDLLPPIVAQLKLPERATYDLIPLGREEPLPPEKTLAENGVPAGAELLLKPVRNQILKVILDKLYEEAQGYVEEQAWELAKEKLTQLLQLDPTYPDPLGVEQAVAAHLPSLRSVPPAERLIQRSKPAQPTRSPLSATVANPTPAPFVSTVATKSSGKGAYQLAPAAKSGSSCLNIALIVIAVLIGGSIAIAGAIVYLPNLISDLVNQLGVSLPGDQVLGTGDVQVTLRWQGQADLDLHVIDPEGQEVWFASPQSASGGTLDVDANGECEGLPRPVENIFWPTRGAPRGMYQVKVVLFQLCESTAPTDYQVTITLDGEVIDVINAQITTEGETHPVANFEY